MSRASSCALSGSCVRPCSLLMVFRSDASTILQFRPMAFSIRSSDFERPDPSPVAAALLLSLSEAACLPRLVVCELTNDLPDEVVSASEVQAGLTELDKKG
eukprot:TRINITY_DN94038_c0_g1_i1.p4 TRINITY_DN94038_c0_g1~~TRINITY_DN94038_c0_g1_i1.p4  ORF type:complete len:101 (+),score=12.81 TRINITY_DN94038_c0_g1_i1:220-522(+)